MKVVVLGTGSFAVPTLQALHRSSHEVLCAVSRPPRGRRAKPAPVFVAAEEQGIETWLPDTVNCEQACEKIVAYAAELLVVCDYGEILKPPALATTRLGGINLHGSLLPKYRGAAPVQWAVFNGDVETGNTVIQMTPGLDAGPALGVQHIPIDPDETAGELEDRMARLGAALVLEVVDQLSTGTTSPVPQDKSRTTKAPRLSKEMGFIDWHRSAQEIKNQVRALQPWPRAFTTWRRPEAEPVRLIIERAQTAPAESPTESPTGSPTGSSAESLVGAGPPGTVLRCDSGIVVATGEGCLCLEEIQPAGKRVMPAADFLRGYPVQPGDRME